MVVRAVQREARTREHHGLALPALNYPEAGEAAVVVDLVSCLGAGAGTVVPVERGLSLRVETGLSQPARVVRGRDRFLVLPQEGPAHSPKRARP